VGASPAGPVGAPSTPMPSPTTGPVPSSLQEIQAPGPSMSSVLGLEGKRQFLVQHEAMSIGHSYRVLDHEKHHLFELKASAAEEIKANFMGGMIRHAAGSVFERGGGERTGDLTFTLVNSGGSAVGAFTKQGSGNQSRFTLADAQGQPWVAITLNRGGFGGMTASAAYPDGRPMIEAKGNLIHHDFRIHDATGAEVAKVHEAWASVRDSYNVEVVGNIDPIFPLALAIVIDYEKEK
jgi:uncharacterized protein YxjI